VSNEQTQRIFGRPKRQKKRDFAVASPGKWLYRTYATRRYESCDSYFYFPQRLKLRRNLHTSWPRTSKSSDYFSYKFSLIINIHFPTFAWDDVCRSCNALCWRVGNLQCTETERAWITRCSSARNYTVNSNKLLIWCVREVEKMNISFVMFVSPARPNGQNRFPLDGFSRNLISEWFL